jgi:hypothetical protein
MLREAGSLTIPLLVVYAADGQPMFKSDFYTAGQVIEAIRAALAASRPAAGAILPISAVRRFSLPVRPATTCRGSPSPSTAAGWRADPPPASRHAPTRIRAAASACGAFPTQVRIACSLRVQESVADQARSALTLTRASTGVVGFGRAAGALTPSIHGDFNLFTAANVRTSMGPRSVRHPAPAPL